MFMAGSAVQQRLLQTPRKEPGGAAAPQAVGKGLLGAACPAREAHPSHPWGNASRTLLGTLPISWALGLQAAMASPCGLLWGHSVMTWGLEDVGQGPGLCDHVPGQRCCGAVEAGAGGGLVEAGAQGEAGQGPSR